ncbi:choice-of-anchor Q domain-containing protein [Lishizhenia sp.]|uniref:choice-of-anchor Q domain-containing protein n=1 Tax=Lishizhenia sp. TaxID=2497594 RepID=UPI00299ED72A|nr:choice-of-anchor Q domain-containing protein [Lishizhenia sp.]MDX1444944.1 choice-of-anchor Q domain-containing protein [Lishizhenia sp.]
MRHYIYIILAFLFTNVVLLTSCKKKDILSTDGISFTTDTLLFDTIFTTVGSTTLNFRIHNTSNRPVKVDEIALMGEANSNFRINVDGISGDVHTDITIPAKDSIYTFVEVTLDPNNGTTPLIIEDSIRFSVNGNYSYVLLAAWGQDAYFYNRDTISGVLPNDKPHVVYSSVRVVDGQDLTIPAGTDFYMHKNAIFYVSESALNINGTVDDPVTFQGDRLEDFYDDVAGQYYGIYFDHAKTSTINHAIIKNGTSGIHIFETHPSNTDYTVKLYNTELYNHASYGLFNFLNGTVYGENVSIHSNGTYAYFSLVGGDYYFKQSNFLSYGGNASVAFALRNHYTDVDAQTTYYNGVNEGKFYNCILDATGDNSFGFDTINDDNNSINFNFEFDYCALKAKDEITDDSRISNILWNRFLGFENQSEKDFHLTAGSPLIDAGSTDFTHSNGIDIEENPRTGVPDIGAYEFQ